MLDKQLQELKQLPEDKQLKEKIYRQLHTKKPKRFTGLKEALLLTIMIAIAFFLFILPPAQQTTTSAGDITLFTAFGGEPGQFFARPSTLYTGVYHEENEQLLDFFRTFDEHMIVTEDVKLGEHIADIVMIQNGKQTRYQMSDTYLLNVDTGVFYQGDETYEDAFNIAYTPHNDPGFAIFMPIVVIILHGVISNRYKKANITFEIPVKYNAPVIMGFLVIMGSSMFYHQQIGPIFKPLLIIFPVAFGLVMWKIIKKIAPSPFVYRMEMIRVLVSFGLLILLLWSM